MVVVGAGPTGITTAILLAQLGVGGVVVERHHEVYPLPRAVHVDDEVVRILQRLGVADGFAAISRPAPGLRLLDADLRPFAVFRRDRPIGHHGHPEANLFDQPDLERLLRARLTRYPAMRLRTGTELVGVEQPVGGPAPVRVTLRDVGTGGVEQLWADVVLGCDGAGSTVREGLGVQLRDLHFTERWFVLDVRSPRPLTDWDGIDQICDPRRAATFMRLTGDRYRWEFRMHDGETVEGLRARVGELIARWTAVEPEILRATDYTFRARIADRWREGRVFLLGDAAHLTPPFIGQGMGAGLRDAHNLAWKLAAVLGGSAAEPLLDSYQAERAPHAETMIRAAVRLGRAMTGGQDGVAALRRVLVRAVLTLPGAQSRALRALPTRFPAGPLVDRRRHRRDLAGTICPQPPVRVDGRQVLLDEILGDGFALLCDGPVDRALADQARHAGARTVRLGTDLDADGDGDGGLQAWLRRGGAAAALLRPDRVVLATARRPAGADR